MISTISSRSSLPRAPTARRARPRARRSGSRCRPGGDESRAPRQRIVELDALRCRDRDRVLILHGVNLDAFVQRGQPEWTELDALVRRAGGSRAPRVPTGCCDSARCTAARSATWPTVAGRFPAIPRCARSSSWSVALAPPCTCRFSGAARRWPLPDGGYWRAVRGQGPVLLAWALLLGSTVLATVWALHDPAAAAGVVPGSLSSGGSAPQHAIGLGAGQSAAISMTIFTNNIGVTFLALRHGNRIRRAARFRAHLQRRASLGAVAGSSRRRPSGRPDRPDRAARLLELSCIAVCAAAGMRMGWALVEPGRYSRRAALATRGRRTPCSIVLSTMPFLIVAGLVEGFVTPGTCRWQPRWP